MPLDLGIAHLRDRVTKVHGAVDRQTFPDMAKTAARIAEAAPSGSDEEVEGAWHSWDAEAMAERLVSLLTKLR